MTYKAISEVIDVQNNKYLSVMEGIRERAQKEAVSKQEAEIMVKK